MPRSPEPDSPPAPAYPEPSQRVLTSLDVSGGTTAISTEDLEIAVEQLERQVVESGLKIRI